MINDIQIRNLYQQAIEALITNGFEVLRIVESNGFDTFFVVYKWEEGYFNSAQSVEFNSVEGINITSFLNKNLNLAQNSSQFIGALNNELENLKVVRLEFSKKIEWYKWSSPQFGNKIVKR